MDAAKNFPIPLSKDLLLKLFTSSLTSFLPYDLTCIAYPFTLVRLRLTQAPDLGSYRPDQLLVNPFQGDLRIFPLVLLRSELQFLRDLENDIVRIAESQVQDITLVGSLETYPDQFELSFISLRHSLHHIEDQRAVQTMQRTVADLVGRTRKVDMVILDLYRDIAIDGLLQFAFRPFHGQEIMFAYRYSYSFGKGHRLFTYTRHDSLILNIRVTLPAGQPV